MKRNNIIFLFLSCLIFIMPSIECRGNSNQDFALGCVIASGVGFVSALFVERVLLPWWSERKARARLKVCSRKINRIRKRYPSDKDYSEESLDVLENTIYRLSLDIEELDCFEEDPCFLCPKAKEKLYKLNELQVDLLAHRRFLEVLRVQKKINQVYNMYSNEIGQLGAGILDRITLKNWVDARCGNCRFRHRGYIQRLIDEIDQCDKLINKIGVSNLDGISIESLGRLKSFFQACNVLLVEEIQKDLEEQSRFDRDQDIHKASLSMIHEETEGYANLKHACEKLQHVIDVYGSMMKDVKDDVNSVKQAVNNVRREIGQDRLTDSFVRKLDQEGSECRIINGTYRAFSNALNNIRRDLAIIKERINYNPGASVGGLEW